MKFARAATGRPRIVSLRGSYHGLSYGALSITGSETFQEGFGPFLADTEMVPLGDLAALEATLAMRDVAAFIVEPIQGKGVNYPDDDYFQRAQALCREYGTLLICDEVQTGLGRTGKWFAFEHWDLEPDIITLAKSLSGGYVPCGAIVTRRSIYQKVFSRLDRCVVHSSTFGRNNLAMACGLASLSVIEDEKLVENSAVMGERLMEAPRRAQGEASLHQGSARQGAHDRHRVPRAAAAPGQDRVAADAQDRPIALHADRRRAAAQPAPGVDAGGRAPHGRHQDPAAAHHHRKGDRLFRPALDETLDECQRFPGPMLELAKNYARTAFRGSNGHGDRRVSKPDERAQWQWHHSNGNGNATVTAVTAQRSWANEGPTARSMERPAEWAWDKCLHVNGNVPRTRFTR